MPNPNIDGARHAATQLIDEYGITDPSQIVLEDIAEDRNVVVRVGNLNGAEGRLIRDGERGIIRVRSNPIYPGRTRFAIAHELGHWERHKHLSQEWVCNSRDIHAYTGSPEEIEANAFASELLMPSSLLKPRIHAGLSIEAVRSVATEFQTSLTATAVRSVEEADEDAFVVFSQEGIVRWWRSSKRADRYFSKSFRVTPDSIAFTCDTPPEDSHGMQEVDISAWFPHRSGDNDVELWEESVYFADLGTVMTLLSLV